MTPCEALEACNRGRTLEACNGGRMKSFQENEAWDLVDVPNAETVLQCKWIFKKKCNQCHKVNYHARLVAKGFIEKLDID